MTGSEKLKLISQNHPFPWREMIHPNGLVQMIDASGREVMIFEMTALMTILTTSLSMSKEKAA